MGQFITSVPNLNYSLSVQPRGLIKGLKEVRLQGTKLSAQIDDSLSQQEYELLSIQLRLTFAFCFKNVYSENYQINSSGKGFHYTGHDERKAYLLGRTYSLTPKFLNSSSIMFNDVLSSTPGSHSKNKAFNLLHIWISAYEQTQLHLPLESQLLLNTIIENMQHERSDVQAGKLVKGLGIIQTESDQFAAKCLLAFKRDDLESARDELEGFSYLYRLRQRQQSVISKDNPYYADKKFLGEIEKKNAFLFEITRLYILWCLGLSDYYLKQNANLYKIARRKK